MVNYNWAMVGAGGIASEMAEALKELGGSVYGVCASRYESAEAFSRRHGVLHAFGSCEEMLGDSNVDIVYVATPHNLHYEMIKKALLAGKHVLCEKSITVDAEELEELVALAAERKLILQEAMTIYHMPLFKKLREVAASGAIGDIKMVQVNFGSCKEYDVNNRFFNKDLAGGALLDIGVYAAAFARSFLSERPEEVLTTVKYFETGVDEQSGIILKNSRDEMAVMALTMRAKQPKRGVVAGEKGYIEVNNYSRADRAVIVYTEDCRTEELVCGEMGRALCYEVEDMEAAVSHGGGQLELEYTRDVMHILTEVKRQWEMK